ncbi:kinase-like domain-containing protein [Diaporthe sp. PMI_573]|nr:kinase-like domain-containing protein [Diaporthaceae sp. PMI_573]
MGIGRQGNTLYTIDFGLAKEFSDAERCKNAEGLPLGGTRRYASIRNHNGLEQSRGDDLESLGYIFVYFARGSLPWQGLKATTDKERDERIKEGKESLSGEALCDGVLPRQFATYIDYTRSLGFDDKPDYLYLLTIKLKTNLEKAKSRIPKSNASKEINEAAIKADSTNRTVVEPTHTSEKGHLINMEPEYASGAAQELPQLTSSAAINEQDKSARRVARRQTRESKWVTRCAAFKLKAKKVAEALFLPAAVIGGIILAPVILVIEIVWFALRVVFELVVRILGLVFCGPVLVCIVCK